MADQSKRVDRSMVLANKLLKLCRADVKQHADMAGVLLALTYVLAEFVAAPAVDNEHLEEGLAECGAMLRGRALECMVEQAERKRRSMN